MWLIINTNADIFSWVSCFLDIWLDMGSWLGHRNVMSLKLLLLDISIEYYPKMRRRCLVRSDTSFTTFHFWIIQYWYFQYKDYQYYYCFKVWRRCLVRSDGGEQVDDRECAACPAWGSLGSVTIHNIKIKDENTIQIWPYLSTNKDIIVFPFLNSHLKVGSWWEIQRSSRDGVGMAEEPWDSRSNDISGILFFKLWNVHIQIQA